MNGQTGRKYFQAVAGDSKPAEALSIMARILSEPGRPVRPAGLGLPFRAWSKARNQGACEYRNPCAPKENGRSPELFIAVISWWLEKDGFQESFFWVRS